MNHIREAAILDDEGFPFDFDQLPSMDPLVPETQCQFILKKIRKPNNSNSSNNNNNKIVVGTTGVCVWPCVCRCVCACVMYYVLCLSV